MKILIQGITTAALAASAIAQTAPSVTQADSTRQQREAQGLLQDLRVGDDMPSLSEDDETDLGPQSVLRKRRHQWFRASVDSQVFYTDNLFFRNEDIPTFSSDPT